MYRSIFKANVNIILIIQNLSIIKMNLHGYYDIEEIWIPDPILEA
jgi:hypothetical protein